MYFDANQAHRRLQRRKCWPADKYVTQDWASDKLVLVEGDSWSYWKDPNDEIVEDDWEFTFWMRENGKSRQFMTEKRPELVIEGPIRKRIPEDAPVLTPLYDCSELGE